MQFSNELLSSVNVEHEQPKQIPVILLTFVVCLLLQIKTVEECHGKS
jgi:hypothetical protein